MSNPIQSKTFGAQTEPAKFLNAQAVNLSMDAHVLQSEKPLHQPKPALRVQTPTPTSFVD